MIAPVGQAVPDTPHAVSVSLPTWRANVGYEEGEEWVLSKMKTGYPRFFIHLTIQELEREVLKLYGRPNEKVMLFPSKTGSHRCQAFFYDKLRDLPDTSVRLLHLEPSLSKVQAAGNALSGLSCIFFPSAHFSTAKQVWQHSGSGISSRRGEFCLQALKEGVLVPVRPASPNPDSAYGKGPRRYQRGTSLDNRTSTTNDHAQDQVYSHTNGVAKLSEDRSTSTFIEERFGRNLNADLASKAKLAVRRRIVGTLVDPLNDLDEALERSSQISSDPASESANARIHSATEDDVYLYPTGMNAIFSAHQLILHELRSRGQPELKSICFGFPYIDTLKTLSKWGPGCQFYASGTNTDLDDLEARLQAGERFAALFTEFPSNPLLCSPNLARIRALADKYSFVVVVDETVGNYININVLSHVDIVVSSLTKIFSGDSNVMGGSLVLNNASNMYQRLKHVQEQTYEDTYWAEDAVFMERNSRDFVSRIDRINRNAEAICSVLKSNQFVKNVYYPKFVDSKRYYDEFRTANGGYGGLLSVTFHDREHAKIFFDELAVQKGPSLGTNFTLASPYVVLAHYTELEWARTVGVDPDLVRVSVGLEDQGPLMQIFEVALKAIEENQN